MGFMTEISVLNDRWGEIRKDPSKFVEQIYQSSMSFGRTPDYVIGQTTVARTHHADDLRVYHAHGNSFFDAYPDKGFDVRRLEMHLGFLKEMKRYLKICEVETKSRIESSKEISNGGI